MTFKELLVGSSFMFEDDKLHTIFEKISDTEVRSKGVSSEPVPVEIINASVTRILKENKK
jgi:hypothetical protein